MNAIVLASEEVVRELPASPLTFGVVTFLFLGFSLWFVLQWNKGR
jgi:hypothetical protein